MCSSRSSWRRPSSTSTCSSVTSTSSAPTSGSLTLRLVYTKLSPEDFFEDWTSIIKFHFRRTPFQFEEWTPYIVPTQNSECDPPQSLGLFSNSSKVECDKKKNKIFPIPTQWSTRKHLCLLVTFWWKTHSSSNLLPKQATSNLPSPGSKRDNDRECIARTANPKLWSSLPTTTLLAQIIM